MKLCVCVRARVKSCQQPKISILTSTGFVFRQVANKEESVDNTEARILLAQEKFAEASEAREDSERQRKVLESRCNLDGVRPAVWRIGGHKLGEMKVLHEHAIQVLTYLSYTYPNLCTTGTYQKIGAAASRGSTHRRGL